MDTNQIKPRIDANMCRWLLRGKPLFVSGKTLSAYICVNLRLKIFLSVIRVHSRFVFLFSALFSQVGLDHFRVAADFVWRAFGDGYPVI